MPWRRKWQPTPVFLPEILDGQRSLAGNGPWSHKEPDMTEHARKDRLKILSDLQNLKKKKLPPTYPFLSKLLDVLLPNKGRNNKEEDMRQDSDSEH